MDITQYQKLFGKEPERYSRTVELKGNKFIPAFPGYDGPGFSTLAEARSYVRSTGATQRNVDAFDLSNLYNRFRRDFDLTVEQHIFRLNTSEQLEAYEKMRFNKAGLPVGQEVAVGNHVRLTRFVTSDGRVMTDAEIAEIFEERYGRVYDPSVAAKAGKRAKAEAVGRANQFELDRLTVHVYDAAADISVDSRNSIRNVPGFDEVMAKERAAFGTTLDEASSRAQQILRQEWFEDAYDIDKIRSRTSSLINAGDREGLIDFLVEEQIKKNYAAKGSDASVIASKAFFSKAETQLGSALGKIDAELRKLPYGQSRMELLSQKKQVEAAIKQVQDAGNGRGVFNLRAVNFDLISDYMTPDMKSFFESINGKAVQIKGNVTHSAWIDDLNAARARQGLAPIDLMVNYSGLSTGGGAKFALTKGVDLSQGGLISRMAGSDPWSSIDLTSFGEGFKATKIDMQSLASFPEFFDMKMLKQAAEDMFAQLDTELEGLSQGKIPSMIEDMLVRQANSEDPFVANNARRLLDKVESGVNFQNDPQFMRQILRVVEESKTRDMPNKLGMARLNVTNSFRAEILSSKDVDGSRHVKPGWIEFNSKKSAWVMNSLDAARYHYAFGGFDFDDAITGNIRVGNDGTLSIIAIRQPNARGEWASFNIAHHDRVVVESVRRQLSDPGLSERYAKTAKKVRDASRQRASGLRKLEAINSQLTSMESEDMYMADGRMKRRAIKLTQEAELLERELSPGGRLSEQTIQNLELSLRDYVKRNNLFQSMPDASSIPGRGKAAFGERVYSPDGTYHFIGEEPLRDLFEDLKYSPGQASSEEVKRVDRAARRMYDKLSPSSKKGLRKATAARLLDNLKAQVLLADSVEIDQGTLGMYSNARMFFDDFMGTNQGALTIAGIKIKSLRQILEQESVIDTLIQGGAVATEDVKSIINAMLRTTMETAIAAKQAGVVAKIDPQLLKIKGFGADAIFRELTDQMDVDYELKDILWDVTNPAEADKARISYVMSLQEEIAGKLEEKRSTITGFADSIMEQQFGMQADSDAEEILRAFRESRRKAAGSIGFENVSGDVAETILQGTRVKELTNTVASNEALRVAMGMFERTVDANGRVTHVMGHRAMAAIARAAQMASGDERISFEAMQAFVDAGIMDEVQGVIEGTVEPGRVTRSSVNASRGQVMVRNEQINQLYKSILTPEEYRAADVMTRRMTESFRHLGETPQLHERAAKIYADTGKVLPYGLEIHAPLDPRTIVSGEDGISTVGSLVQEYFDLEGQGQASRRAQILETLTGAAKAHLEASSHVAGMTGLNPLIRDAMLEAMTEYGGDKAEQARRIATQAADVAAEGAKGQRLISNKKAALAVGAIAAMAVIATRRPGDRTIEEIQGPDNLPGGNPYTGQGQMAQGGVIPPVRTAGSGSGVTYQVRASGRAQKMNGFLDEVRALTGSEPNVARHEVGGFQSDRIIEEIMRSY